MMTTAQSIGLGKTGSRPMRPKVDVLFCSVRASAFSEPGKVRGPKAEHFLASCSYAKLVRPRRFEDFQRTLCRLIFQYLDKRLAW
jgi:hypothetical protein